jgi:uncharacterized protein YgiM (DUF1202 family)
VSNDIVGQLRPGAEVTVIGRNNQGNDWLLVEYENTRGWVAFFVVSVTGDLDRLPLSEPDAGSAPADSPPAAPIVEAIEFSPPATDSSLVMATAFRRANVRSEPNRSSPVIGVLERGDDVIVLGRSSEQNDWLWVQFDDQQGWVAFFLVSVEGDIGAIPIIEPESAVELAPPAAAASESNATIVVIARYNINLRAEPSLNADIVARVPFNTELVANARTGANTWLRVEFSGQQGWLLATLVSATDSVDIEALPTAG